MKGRKKRNGGRERKGKGRKQIKCQRMEGSGGNREGTKEGKESRRKEDNQRKGKKG